MDLNNRLPDLDQASTRKFTTGECDSDHRADNCSNRRRKERNKHTILQGNQHILCRKADFCTHDTIEDIVIPAQGKAREVRDGARLVE